MGGLLETGVVNSMEPEEWKGAIAIIIIVAFLALIGAALWLSSLPPAPPPYDKAGQTALFPILLK